MNRILKPGILQERRLNETSFRYYLFIPQHLAHSTPIFVTIHGWSRNVIEHAEGYLPFARERGVILIAPYFGRRHFPQFQQLGNNTSSGRADRILDMIIAEVTRLTGVPRQPFYLFGYSGGGQFAHRYAMAHPENIVKAALGAPGWYTFPEPAWGFPLGIGPNACFEDIYCRPAAFLKVPMRVFVGELDIYRNHHFNTSRKIDQYQGTNRQERAQRWVRAMMKAAAAIGYTTEYSFEFLPNSDHSFTNCMKNGLMGEKVFRFLFGRDGIVADRSKADFAKSK